MPITIAEDDFLKLKTHFCISLIDKACENNWEDHELGKLLCLFASDISLSGKKLFKFLMKAEIQSPSVLSELMDAGFELSTSHVLSLITCNCKNVPKALDEALEQGLFHLTDEMEIKTLCDAIFQLQDEGEFMRCVNVLCCHAELKSSCAKILRVVTADMELSEALKIVQDVTSHDYFMDLSGKLNDFLSHVSEDEHTSLAIEHMMVHDEGRTAEGDLLDSDVDENGNIKGLFCESDVESECGISDDSSLQSDSDEGDVYSVSSDGGDEGQMDQVDHTGLSSSDEDEAPCSRTTKKVYKRLNQSKSSHTATPTTPSKPRKHTSTSSTSSGNRRQGKLTKRKSSCIEDDSSDDEDNGQAHGNTKSTVIDLSQSTNSPTTSCSNTEGKNKKRSKRKNKK